MTEKYKVLVGYDGSECADAAIDDLTRAGLPDETELIVLSVSDVWELPVGPAPIPPTPQDLEAVDQYLAEALNDARLLAEEAAGRIRTAFPSWAVTSEARSGAAAWEIIECSDEWKANLIVMGSHGRSAIARVVLGSVSQKVLHEALCPVRIARKRTANDDSPPRILIAVDGSEFAETAVKAVACRNWPTGTEFRLITADDDPGSRPEVSLIDYVQEGREDSDDAKAWIKRVLETPEQILKDAGLRSSQFVRWGDARLIILTEADMWKADSIFMGARGIGRFRRFLLGSVSSAVAAKAKCSVEIIR